MSFPNSSTRNADVLVVGAGLSGLSALRELHRAGISALGVEARTRIGGRVTQSRTERGQVFEAGGEIVKPGHGRVLALLEEFGIDTVPLDPAAGANVIIENGARTLEREPFDSDTNRKSEYARLRRLFAHLADSIVSGDVQDKSEYVSLADWLAQGSADSLVRNRLGRELVFGMGGRSADSVSLNSAALYFGAAHSLAATGPAVRICGGGFAIASHLASAIDPRNLILGSRVESIQVSGGEVLVSAVTRQFRGKIVILALSPTLARSIRFGPPLGEPRQSTISAWVQACAIKSVIVFDHAWWRDQGMSGFAQGDLSNSVVMDVSPPNRREGVLLAFENQEPGEHSQLSADDCRDRVLSDLREYFGSLRSDVIDFGSYVWSSDPLAGGCGSPLRPGLRATNWTTGAPAGSPIIFAGTEASGTGWGSMEGAIRAGGQAARAAIDHLRTSSG